LIRKKDRDERERRIKDVSRRIGKRKLIWFGIRGTDAQPLLSLSQTSESISITAPFQSYSVKGDCCIETMLHRRVDLDTYNIDNDKSDEAILFRNELYKSMGEPCVVIPYGPTRLLSSVRFHRSGIVQYWGMFKELHAPFEHKPWVESMLRKAGVRTVPWRYFGQNDQKLILESIESGPVVARLPQSAGGVGVSLIERPEDINTSVLKTSDDLIAIGPALEPNVPISVNAVVFSNGEVSLHPSSVQLLGLTRQTRRYFGYCGNDFAKIKDMNKDVLDELEKMVRITGKWLSRTGYLGAFGIDALIHNENVYLCEVNPRFQGSSHLSAQLDILLDRSDQYLEHIAAYLNLPPCRDISLHTLVNRQKSVSQIFTHNIMNTPMKRKTNANSEIDGVDVSLLPDKGVCVEPDAVLFRAVIRDVVTEHDKTIAGNYKSLIDQIESDNFTLIEERDEDEVLEEG